MLILAIEQIVFVSCDPTAEYECEAVARCEQWRLHGTNDHHDEVS